MAPAAVPCIDVIWAKVASSMRRTGCVGACDSCSGGIPASKAISGGGPRPAVGDDPIARRESSVQDDRIRRPSVQVHMQDDYNEFSDLQGAGGAMTTAALERFSRQVLQAVGPRSGKFVIAEYGCSTGGNSILPVAAVCSSVKIPVLAIMNDRPQNNWRVLEETLDRGLQSIADNDGVEFKYAANSMFRASVAEGGSVHIGFTNYACHWLKHCPSNFVDGMWANQRMLDAADEHRLKWAAQSKEDLENLLHFRAEEIAPGGIFLLGTWASDDGKFIMNSYDVMADVKAKMLQSGQITEEMAKKLCMPEYARTIGEVFDVLQTRENREAWLVRECHTVRINCQYQKELQQGQITAAECAAKQMMSSKVVYAYFVEEALGPELAEQFWQMVQGLSALDPTGERGSTSHVYNIFVLQRLS